MLYVLETRRVPLFKLGYSGDDEGVEQRLRGNQTGCPFKLDLAFSVSGERKHEQTILKFLRNYRTNGEWFRKTAGSARILEVLREHGGPSAVPRLGHLKSREPEVFGIPMSEEENAERAWEVMERLEAEVKAFEARFTALYRKERAELETRILRELHAAGIKNTLFHGEHNSAEDLMWRADVDAVDA
jgi:hypothetical protein